MTIYFKISLHTIHVLQYNGLLFWLCTLYISVSLLYYLWVWDCNVIYGINMGGHPVHMCEMWNRMAWISSGWGVILDNRGKGVHTLVQKSYYTFWLKLVRRGLSATNHTSLHISCCYIYYLKSLNKIMDICNLIDHILYKILPELHINYSTFPSNLVQHWSSL